MKTNTIIIIVYDQTNSWTRYYGLSIAVISNFYILFYAGLYKNAISHPSVPFILYTTARLFNTNDQVRFLVVVNTRNLYTF